MIVALDLNRSTYENFLGMDINDIRSTITCGIDRTFDQIKKSDEGLVVGDEDEDEDEEKDKDKEEEMKESHKKAKSANPKYWFSSPDCAQVLANTYCVPVCIYPDTSPNNMTVPLTYLPLNLPRKLTNKPNPIHIQNINGCNWGAVKFKQSHSKSPIVYSLYFNIAGKEEDYRKYWNRWG